MKNNTKIIFSILFIGITSFGFSQKNTLSKNALISVLTCGEGNELYSTFGHNAFRVWDPVYKTDYVYNYGIFDFNAPYFYLNFVKGRLLFKVDKQDFPRFLYEYQYDKRWVKEQVLNLTYSQKQQLHSFLENNIKPENRDYLYDYLYDNCATKIIEVLQSALGKSILFNENHLKKKYTFRELLDQKLTTNSWASFGIDLALASKIDKKAAPLEHTFIPDYVISQLNNSTIDNRQLVLNEKTILKGYTKVQSINFMGTPLFWLCLLLAVVIFITYMDLKNKMWSKWLDTFLFFTSGTIGLILLLMWFATDHTASANNFNLLWAFPLNILVFFFLTIKKKLPLQIHNYCFLLLILLTIIPIIQLIGIQKFHPALIPVLLSLTIRYLFIWHKTKIN